MKILVALSGGVDSAVAALLLKKEGHQVHGAYMRTWMNEDKLFADCPWAEDLQYAQSVASHLSIPFKVVNMIDAYKEYVVQELVSGYQQGITPNPDILCNRHIKFGTLLSYALENGFDGLATGHYCQKIIGPNQRFQLHEGKDTNKDQSYFLSRIHYSQLEKAFFPIGPYTKPEVRALALAHHLPNATRKDSQGICFLGKVPINDFLKQYIPDHPGPIVDLNGKVLGTHLGLHRYTLGQRKGLGIPSNIDFEHYVVIKKDYHTHTLTVAFDQPQTPHLYHTHTQLEQLHYIDSSLSFSSHPSFTVLAKTRYREPTLPILLTPQPNHTAHILFSTPQRALTPGQVLAFYKNTQLLGSGIYHQS